MWLCFTEGKEIPTQSASSLQQAILVVGERPLGVCSVPWCHPLLPRYTSLQTADSRCNRFPLALHANGLPQTHLVHKQTIPRHQYQSGYLHTSPQREKKKLYWICEDLPREDRVEITFSLTPWARLRSKQSSAWMAGLASSSEAKRSTMSHTPAPLTTNPGLSPSPGKWGTRQRSLQGGWVLKTGLCRFSIPVGVLREPRRPQRSLGSQ